MSNEQKAAQPPAEGLPDAAPKQTMYGELREHPSRIWSYGGFVHEEDPRVKNPAITEACEYVRATPVTTGIREALAAIDDEIRIQEEHFGEVNAAAAAGSRMHEGEARVTGDVILGLQYARKRVAALSSLGAAPRARTGRECWGLWNADDGRFLAWSNKEGAPDPDSNGAWVRLAPAVVEAGALPATQGEAVRVFDMSGWPHGKIVEIDPDGRARSSMSMEIYEVVRKAQGEGKEEGPVGGSPLPVPSAQGIGRPGIVPLGMLYANLLHNHPNTGKGWEIDGEKAVLVPWEDLERVREAIEARSAPEPSPAKGPSPENPTAPAVSEAAGQGVDESGWPLGAKHYHGLCQHEEIQPYGRGEHQCADCGRVIVPFYWREYREWLKTREDRWENTPVGRFILAMRKHWKRAPAAVEGEGAGPIDYKASPWVDTRQKKEGKPGCKTCGGYGWITIRERAYRCLECGAEPGSTEGAEGVV